MKKKVFDSDNDICNDFNCRTCHVCQKEDCKDHLESEENQKRFTYSNLKEASFDSLNNR